MLTPLRRSRIIEGLGEGHRFASDLRVLGIAGSTSDLVLQAGRAGAGDGLVVTAEGQTAGRGRRGTGWVSPARRGLWFSTLISPPPDDRRLLAPAVGLAVTDALSSLGVRPQLKWPNDVLVDGQKVAGCLVDLADDDQGRAFAVVGIGINVNLGRDDLPTDGVAWPAGSLALALGRPVDREALLVATLSALGNRLAQAAIGDHEGVAADWRPLDALVGRSITATESGDTVSGRVVDIDPAVGLTLETPTGSRTLRAEVTHVTSVDRA